MDLHHEATKEDLSNGIQEKVFDHSRNDYAKALWMVGDTMRNLQKGDHKRTIGVQHEVF